MDRLPEKRQGSLGPIGRLLLIAGLSIAALGLAVELIHGLTHIHRYDELLFLFSLSYEQNLPTWYSSMLLFCSGLAVWQRRAHAPSHRLHWRGLALGLMAASIDESVELHERLGGLVGTSGILYFDWVIPAGLVVAVVAILYLPFLRSLPRDTGRRFLLAAAVYLGGALLMELPLGYWTEGHGTDNLGYALIDWVEECLEICGASLFLHALLGLEASR